MPRARLVHTYAVLPYSDSRSFDCRLRPTDKGVLVSLCEIYEPPGTPLYLPRGVLFVRAVGQLESLVKGASAPLDQAFSGWAKIARFHAANGLVKYEGMVTRRADVHAKVNFPLP